MRAVVNAMYRARALGRAPLDRAARWSRFVSDFVAYRRLAAAQPARFALSWRDRYPCLNDSTVATGFDRHYIYHTAWAARLVKETRPPLHVDISSSLYFCAIVSAFCPVRFYDYRPADLRLSSLETGAADLLALPFSDNSIDSLSCMHVVEHVGLGRYGDRLDPNGDLKAITELKRALARGGNLLFVVPVGRPRIMFNAHRIYAYDQIVDYLSELDLREFSLIPDSPRDGGLVRNATKGMADAQAYGCGCFWFRKPG